RVQKHSGAHALEEPKKISEALKDYSWVEAMQEELLQFRLQQTATASTLADGTLELRATIDTIEYTITEAYVRKIQTKNKHPYLAIVLTKKIFGNMKRGFRGVPKPLFPAMLPVVAVDQNAGQADQAVDQPSPFGPLPSSSYPPVISTTIESEPTPVAEPTPHPKSLSPEPDSEPIEHTFEQPSPEHQPLSLRQETEVPHS
ncbi:hypothetical protein Tco_1258860, partial [Tanacetum coccineum]